jgi:hypothetical protein
MAHIPRRTALASLGHPLSAALQMAGLLFQSLCKYALMEAKDKRQTEERAKPFVKKGGANPVQYRSVPADSEVAVAPHR